MVLSIFITDWRPPLSYTIISFYNARNHFTGVLHMKINKRRFKHQRTSPVFVYQLRYGFVETTLLQNVYFSALTSTIDTCNKNNWCLWTWEGLSNKTKGINVLNSSPRLLFTSIYELKEAVSAISFHWDFIQSYFKPTLFLKF